MPALDYLKDYRITVLILVILALAMLDYTYGGPNGLHLGIEFVGGTQIPITLEHSVTPDQMSNLTSILQQRTSTFGLKQVTVEGIGSSAVYVVVPTVSNSEIQSTINIIESQGVFQGIVSGKEALNGSSILSGGIGAAPPTTFNGNVTWTVSFFITQQAAVHFAKVVFGQANQPLYMFLDRPTSSVVIINQSLLLSASSLTGPSNLSAETTAMENAVALGNRTIPIQILNPSGSNWKAIYAFLSANRNRYNNVIVAQNTSKGLISNITSLNYSITRVNATSMAPTFEVPQTATGQALPTVVDTWPAVGLLSAPTLNPGITNGSIGQSYEISGAALPSLTLAQKQTYAEQQSKTIASILSGGALPVHVIVGTPTTIPATLGQHFEYISIVIALLAILAVSIVIVVRYRKPFLIVPIILITLAELFIIVSIIGLVGTIDLAAVAGMIAVVGTGVDAQIIITDEIVSGGSAATMKMKIGNAFYVVWADAALLIIAMMPLLFSTSLVSIIGFSESTILGALLGVLITRPAYGAIVSRRFEKSEKHG